MKIVLDTNVWIASFISHGVCHELVEHVIVSHEVLFSSFILEEVEEKLSKKFKIPSGRVTEYSRYIRENAQEVRLKKKPEKISRDPDDDWILETALVGKARCILTGDKDLLDLHKHKSISLLKPNEFWVFERK